MNLAVLGCRGMLGHMLVRCLAERGHAPRALDRADVDAAPDRLAGVDVLVNAVVFYEPEPMDLKRAIQVNTILPRSLATRVRRLVHISTDGVFSGSGGPYTEADAPDDGSVYGITKVLGEAEGAMVLRCSIVGPELTRHRHLMARLTRSSGEVTYANRQKWNGLTTLCLAECIACIIEQELWENGVFHLFGEDTTRLDLARGIVRALDSRTKVEESSDGGPVRDRRLRTVRKLASRLPIPPFERQLENLVTLMKSSPEYADYVGR
jgi:dTDP-4-dehydrorhamnose reductase